METWESLENELDQHLERNRQKADLFTEELSWNQHRSGFINANEQPVPATKTRNLINRIMGKKNESIG